MTSESPLAILDEWASEEALGASHLHLHALGVISLAFNRLEHGLSFLFSDLVATNRSIGTSIYGRLSNRSRVDVLRELVLWEAEPSVKQRLLIAIKHFEICAENRNTLMHLIDDEMDRDILKTRKLSSDKSRLVFYDISVPSLRKTAEDMQNTYHFVVYLSFCLFRREEQSRRAASEQTPFAWPDIPPTPSKLSPRPPPKVQ